jgi:ArsR family transcriptional regulator
MNDLRRIERIFNAVGNDTRLRILKMLEVKPRCVCEVTHILGIAQSSVSRHLGLLRDAGLIDNRKDGLWVNYSLVSSTDDVIASIVVGLRRWGNEDPQITKDKEKARTAKRESICAKG